MEYRYEFYSRGQLIQILPQPSLGLIALIIVMYQLIGVYEFRECLDAITEISAILFVVFHFLLTAVSGFQMC